MMIDGGVLATAICTSTQSIHGQPRVLAGVPGRPELGWTTASQSCTADSVPVYYMSSGSFQTMPEDMHYPHLFLRTDLLSRAQPLELGKVLQVRATEAGVERPYELESESTFVLAGQPAVEAGRTLHEWQGADGMVTRLRLESRVPTADRPGPMFMVCWQVVVPRLARSTCNVHDLADGTFRGLEITDDSAGTGAITWIGNDPINALSRRF